MTEDGSMIQSKLERCDLWVVSSVEAFRVAAASWPTAETVVWEIGAATGAATALAAGVAKQVVAVEKAAEKLEKLKAVSEAHPNVTVIEADGPDGVPADARADLLLIDIGGDAPPWKTLELTERWADALNCERVILRNSGAYRLLASAAAASGATPSAEAGEMDPTLLVQQVLATSSRDVARKLSRGLADAGFKARQRLVEGLVCLGPTALRPLTALVADVEADLAARRAAAEAMRQIAQRVDSDTRRALRKESTPVDWALGPLAGDAESPGAILAEAEGAKRMAEPEVLLRLLDHPDELVQFIARQHVRNGGAEAAEVLTRAIAGEKSFFGPVIAALDALSDVKRVDADRVVGWYLDTAGTDEATCWRVAAAALGVADAKWAQSLLGAVRAKSEDVPTELLADLLRAAQKNPRDKDSVRLLKRVVECDAPIAALATAASLSPHPWMREIADALGEATYEEE